MHLIDNQHPVAWIRPPVFAATDDNFLSFFATQGFVVIKKTNLPEIKQVQDCIYSLLKENTPGHRRLGFLDLYHDQCLAQIRTQESVLQPFQKIFKTDKLWVVFDRLIVTQAGENLPTLPAHIDQNMITHPNFFSVQGMLALADMNPASGSLAIVPGSHLQATQYQPWTKFTDGFVNYQGPQLLSFQALKISAGELIIWDSRLTHSRHHHETQQNRYAMLISYLPAPDNEDLRSLRIQAYHAGIGLNHQAAGLRATANPRCPVSLRKTPEILTPLGRKLYGLDSWFKDDS